MRRDQYVCITRPVLAIIALLALSNVMTGCEDKKNTNRPRVQAGVAVPMQVAAQSDADERRTDDEFMRNAQRAMQRLRVQIDELGARARQATGEARERLERRIAELEPRWREAQARLEEARGKADTALRDARERFGKAFESLRQSVRDAKKEFDRS